MSDTVGGKSNDTMNQCKLNVKIVNEDSRIKIQDEPAVLSLEGVDDQALLVAESTQDEDRDIAMRITAEEAEKLTDALDRFLQVVEEKGGCDGIWKWEVTET